MHLWNKLGQKYLNMWSSINSILILTWLEKYEPYEYKLGDYKTEELKENLENKQLLSFFIKLDQNLPSRTLFFKCGISMDS